MHDLDKIRQYRTQQENVATDYFKDVVALALDYQARQARFNELDKQLSPRQAELFRDYFIRSAILRLPEAELEQSLDAAFKLATQSQEY